MNYRNLLKRRNRVVEAKSLVEVGKPDEAEKLLEKNRQETEKIEAFIATLDDPLERAVIRFRFVALMSWDEICVECGYSNSKIMEVFKDAMAKKNATKSKTSKKD